MCFDSFKALNLQCLLEFMCGCCLWFIVFLYYNLTILKKCALSFP